ncbi:hypothetical protein ACI78T_06705 [Blastococcus sp. SYSU D00922]
MSQHLAELTAQPMPSRTLPSDTVPRPREESIAPLAVTLVGGDEEQRRRLAGLLAGVPGVVVTGWSDTATSLAVLEACSALDVLISPPAAPPQAPLRRPVLASRQRDVLVAYSAGNELLDVAARGLGMNPETFKTHLRRIRAKYREVGRDAPTRRDLYVRAVQDGYLPPPA